MASKETTEALEIAAKALKLAISNGASGKPVQELIEEIMNAFAKEVYSLQKDIAYYGLVNGRIVIH